MIDALRAIKSEFPSAPLRVIADELAARGFKSRTGKTFAPNQINRLLNVA
jgi:hypothetical protein